MTYQIIETGLIHSQWFSDNKAVASFDTKGLTFWIVNTCTYIDLRKEGLNEEDDWDLNSLELRSIYEIRII